MKNLSKLAEKIRSINKANGWNLFFEKEINRSSYFIPSIVCLIHSDIAEASKELEKDDIDALMYKLAATAIFILDFSGGFEKNEFDRHTNKAKPPNYGLDVSLDKIIIDLHCRCADILKAYDKNSRDKILTALAKLYVAIEAFGICLASENETCFNDLYDYMFSKIEQSRSHVYRHNGSKHKQL